MVNIAYKKANTILCVSNHIKSTLDTKLKTTKKTFVIYNPFNFEKIITKSEELLDYKTQNKVLITVARLESPKNLSLLIKSFSNICKTNHNVELWIIGNGSLYNKLNKQVDSLNIKNQVIFWGRQDNPYKFLKHADFFVSSSDFEGFPLSVIEALILKKRVVTTFSISDFQTLLTKDLGTIVPIQNEELLTQAIKTEIENNYQIINQPEILNNFKLEIIANKYLEFANL